MTVLTGWCLDCGLRYACIEDWLDHQGAHPDEPNHRSAYREPSPLGLRAERRAWEASA